MHNTHEWIAFKAATSLPDEWKKVFIKHVEKLLEGAKAPDRSFHDFRNHVMHPPKWGGAPSAALKWKENMINALKDKNWSEAVYSAGVLSHYIADPFHPLHTGQTAEEAKIHKFFEFGTSRSLKKYDSISMSRKENLALDEEIIKGATRSHEYYFDVITMYDPSKANKNKWEDGIPDELHEIIKQILEEATSLVHGAWLDAIKEAAIKPPKTNLTFTSFIMRIKAPIYFVKKWLANRYFKTTTKKMLKELREKGTVYQSIPPDDRLQIDVFIEMEKDGKLDMSSAIESFEKRRNTKLDEKYKKGMIPRKKKEISPTKARTKEKAQKDKMSEEKTSEKDSRKRRGLQVNDPIVDAPEIGRRTAEKLSKVGINTVGNFLDASFEKMKDFRPTPIFNSNRSKSALT